MVAVHSNSLSCDMNTTGTSDTTSCRTDGSGTSTTNSTSVNSSGSGRGFPLVALVPVVVVELANYQF